MPKANGQSPKHELSQRWDTAIFRVYNLLMCARYELKVSPDALYELLDIDSDEVQKESRPEALRKLDESKEQLNIRPTDSVLIATNQKPRLLQSAFWGLLSKWSEPRPGHPPLRPINARDDKLESRPWRHFAEAQRCLIPATSFFEWRETPGMKKKQPVKFSLKGGAPFCFAGLWNVYKAQLSCTIITTTPSPLVSLVHDRMPAILSRDAMAVWMSQGEMEIEELRALLGPYPAQLMKSEDVDPRGADAAPPNEPRELQLSLF